MNPRYPALCIAMAAHYRAQTDIRDRLTATVMAERCKDQQSCYRHYANTRRQLAPGKSVDKNLGDAAF
jgi:uncharacterized membrane-anchored protein YhcB (DUF1043 family)